MSDTTCNAKSISAEDVEAIRLQNLPKIYNFASSQPESTPEPEITVATEDSESLEAKILNVLAATDGSQSPSQVQFILENNGFVYTNKKICDRMWAMEKKHLIAKVGKGQYSSHI